MKRYFLSVLALAAVATASLVAPSSVLAQAASKPAAVISISSFDKLSSSVSYLAGLGGQDGTVMVGLGIAKPYLTGVDPAKPWGMVLLSEDRSEPAPIIFIPLADCKPLLTKLKDPLHLEFTEEGAGVFAVKGPNRNAYVTSAGGWTFIALSADDLKKAPADPVKLLDGLEKTYDIAARLYVQNFSAGERQLAVGAITSFLQSNTMRAAPGEDADALALRKKSMQTAIKGIEKLANDLDQVTVGWATDSKSDKKKMVLDFGFLAVAGSDTAKQMAEVGDMKSMFGGFFMADSGVSTQLVSKLNAEAIDQYTTILNAWSTKAQKQIDDSADFPNDDARKQAKVAVDELSKAALDTVKGGQLDVGAAMIFEPGALKVVAGAQVASGPAFESGIKKLIDLVKGELNTELKDLPAYKGISMHTMSVPVSDPQAAAFLGDKLDVYLGFAAKSVYLSLGKGGEEALKKSIDSSEASASKAGIPSQFVVALKPLFDFANSIHADPMIGMLNGKLAEAPGMDHVWISAKPIPNGISEHIEIEEGVLKAIGAAAAKGAGGPGGAPQ